MNNGIKFIQPDIQETILNILPDYGPNALNLMAQLTANMLISIDGANINDYIVSLNNHLVSMEGT